MKYKKDTYRYLIISIIYIIAILFASLCIYFLPLPLWSSILIADIVATIIVFIFSLIFKNASIYDPYWSIQPIIIIIALMIIKENFSIPNILLICAIFIWGIRLTLNWAYTCHGLQEKYQDWRYTMLHEKTGKYYIFINFLGIHLVPTLIVYSCMFPVIMTFDKLTNINIGCIIFFIVCLLAIFLEGLADCTMHKFKKNKTTPFIRNGIWKYSRHPNYLGEITFWWGISLFVICLKPTFWWMMFGALLNTLLFLFISIPMSDKHQSRKEGFNLYKRNTRMLLPIYKKQTNE